MTLPVLLFFFSISECQNDDSATKQDLVVTGANLQATIGDLTPFTCYNVQVRARNGVGQSAPGPPSVDFYTEPEGRCLHKDFKRGFFSFFF